MNVRSAATGLYATCTVASVPVTTESPIISVFTFDSSVVNAVSGTWNRPVSLYDVGVRDRSSKKNSEPTQNVCCQSLHAEGNTKEET